MVLYRAWDSGRDVLVRWNDSVPVKCGAFAWRLASVFVLLFGIFVTMPAQVVRAQTPGGGNSVIAQLISRVESAKLAELGFTDAEQSVIAATYNAMSEAALGASGVAGGAWLAVAALVGAVGMAVPTQLGDDTLTAWRINHDGTVTPSQVQSGAGDYPPLTGALAHVWCANAPGGNGLVCGSSLEAGMEAVVQAYGATGLVQCDQPNWCFYSHLSSTGSGSFLGTQDLGSFFGGKSFTCASGMATGDGVCIAYAPPVPPDSSGGLSVADAIAAIPADDLDHALSPDVLADLINGLWAAAAAQPGYQGVPYPATNPVTADDVTAVESPTASDWPTVGTAVAPVSAPTGGGNPYAIPVGTGTPAGGSDPASSPSAPSGSDTSKLCAEFPDIIACQTPGSATAPDLPTSSASVSVSPVEVGPSSGVCPSPVALSVLGMDFSISYQSQCDFMARVRPFVLAMCGIIAAVIFGMGLKS